MEAKIPIGTIASVVGIGSGIAGIAGSLLGSGAQQSAATQGANTQLQMYNQTRNDLAPYSQGGAGAFSNLSSLLGMGGTPNTSGMLSALQNYPGYQFALDQGGQALDRSAASRGQLLSGGQLKDLTAYGQGMGSQLFDKYFNQNSQLASLGENAAAQTGNAGTSAAYGAAQSQLAAGTAAASGITGATNALAGPNGVLQNALQAYQLSNPSVPAAQQTRLDNLGLGAGNPGYQNTVQLPSGY